MKSPLTIANQIVDYLIKNCGGNAQLRDQITNPISDIIRAGVKWSANDWNLGPAAHAMQRRDAAIAAMPDRVRKDLLAAGFKNDPERMVA